MNTLLSSLTCRPEEHRLWFQFVHSHRLTRQIRSHGIPFTTLDSESLPISVIHPGHSGCLDTTHTRTVWVSVSRSTRIPLPIPILVNSLTDVPQMEIV